MTQEVARVTDSPIGTAQRLHAILESPAQTAEIQKILPANISLDRFKRIIVNACQAKPDLLLNCSGASLFTAIMNAGAVGLEPDTALGLAWLIPEGGLASYKIGYKGFLLLAREVGLLKSIYAEVVYKDDRFEVRRGTHPEIIHEPALSGKRDPRNITYAYAVAVMPSGDLEFTVIDRATIENARGCAKTQKVWAKWYDEMAKKVALRRLCKTLPLGERFAQAEQIDNQDYDLSKWGKPASGSPGVRESHPLPQLEDALMPPMAVLDVEEVDEPVPPAPSPLSAARSTKLAQGSHAPGVPERAPARGSSPTLRPAPGQDPVFEIPRYEEPPDIRPICPPKPGNRDLTTLVNGVMDKHADLKERLGSRAPPLPRLTGLSAERLRALNDEYRGLLERLDNPLEGELIS